MVHGWIHRGPPTVGVTNAPSGIDIDVGSDTGVDANGQTDALCIIRGCSFVTITKTWPTQRFFFDPFFF